MRRSEVSGKSVGSGVKAVPNSHSFPLSDPASLIRGGNSDGNCLLQRQGSLVHDKPK